jgi:hypothetical protein
MDSRIGMIVRNGHIVYYAYISGELRESLYQVDIERLLFSADLNK